MNGLEIGIFEDDAEADAVAVGEEDLARRDQRAEMGDGLVGAEYDDGIGGWEPRIGQVFAELDAGTQRSRKGGGECFGFGQACGGQFAEIIRAEEQAANEALQCGVRSIAADDVQDDGWGNCAERWAGRDGLKAIEGGFVAKLDPEPIEKYLR